MLKFLYFHIKRGQVFRQIIFEKNLALEKLNKPLTSVAKTCQEDGYFFGDYLFIIIC